jgi:hypothetical protein
MIGGGRVMLISELLKEVFVHLRPTSLLTSAVPEQFALLRTLQLVSDNRKSVTKMLADAKSDQFQ